MSAIALWFDGASELQSITFFPNPTGKKATPKDMELKVHGLWDANEALRKQNAIAVVAKSMLRVDEGLNTFAGLDRQSSVNPDGTFPAKRLRLSRKSGSSLKS